MDRVAIGPVKGLRIAVAAFVLSVFLAVVMVAGGGYLLAEGSREATETHEAICALIGDLETRTQASRHFLREHPTGIPGISRATIQQGIENQQRSIIALSVVDC